VYFLVAAIALFCSVLDNGVKSMNNVEEMEGNVSFEDPLVVAIKAWLGFSATDELRVDAKSYEVFKGEPEYDSEEMWEIPKAVDVCYSISDYTSGCFAWGAIDFCEYKGKRYVIEQNASPITIYGELSNEDL
jgi:hypothetical protein